MINERENVLKGQNNLAQANPGLPGVALGWGNGNKIVREEMPYNGLSCIRTKWNTPYSRMDILLHSVRTWIFSLNNGVSRTVLPAVFLPGATPRAEIIWPFRPKRQI